MAKKGFGGVYSETERTPYSTLGRLSNPKETFKATLTCLKPHLRGQAGTLLDVGCANGELIHYLAQNLPGWTFSGIDITPGFIEVANGIGLPNASFATGDLLSAKGQFDVVTCIGTLPMFEDIETALQRLMDLCAPNGIILVDGFFNAANMDVRIEYRENHGEPDTAWHVGFNHFSRARVSQWLSSKGAAFDYYEVPFNADLPKDPSKPPVSAWSFRDEAGKRLLTNGLGILVNTTMLTIRPGRAVA